MMQTDALLTAAALALVLDVGCAPANDEAENGFARNARQYRSVVSEAREGERGGVW